MCGNYILSSLVSSFFVCVFSSFLLTLSGALSEHKRLPPGLLFFSCFVFLWKWLQHRIAFCSLPGRSQRLAQRQEDQQAEPNCSEKNLDLTPWKRKSAFHVTWGYNVHPSPSLSQPKGESLFYHHLLHLNWMAAKLHVTLFSAPVPAKYY